MQLHILKLESLRLKKEKMKKDMKGLMCHTGHFKRVDQEKIKG